MCKSCGGASQLLARRIAFNDQARSGRESHGAMQLSQYYNLVHMAKHILYYISVDAIVKMIIMPIPFAPCAGVVFRCIGVTRCSAWAHTRRRFRAKLLWEDACEALLSMVEDRYENARAGAGAGLKKTGHKPGRKPCQAQPKSGAGNQIGN